MSTLAEVWRKDYETAMSDNLDTYPEEQQAQEAIDILELRSGTHEENLVTLARLHAGLTGFFDRYGTDLGPWKEQSR